MTNDSANKIGLRDGWTHDPDYRSCYQKADDVESVLRLLALTPNCSLVDVGCGNGAFAIAAARKEPACRVWAFDALDSAVAECKAKAAGLANIDTAKAWADSIPLADLSVDRALFRSVLHHISQPQAVYGELGRVLKPGGRLVLQAPCNGWDGAVAEVLSGMMMLHENSHRRFYYRPSEIADGLQRAGFSSGKPECWPYEFPFLEDREAQFIKRGGVEKELRLRPIQPGKWSIEGCWVRIVAEKSIG
jgi:SAM-dependent methyltransferase